MKASDFLKSLAKTQAKEKAKLKPYWEVRYIIGKYCNETNLCYYLNFGSMGANWTRDLLRISAVDAKTANKMVEKNLYKGKKLVYKKNRKKETLFVSKVFYNDYNGEVRLTKQNSFQLMEVVVNNI